jgi:hypothetical protein
MLPQEGTEHCWLGKKNLSIFPPSYDVEVEAVEAILDIAAMCTDADPGQRPSMSAVLKMLEEEILSPCMSELYYEQHLEL